MIAADGVLSDISVTGEVSDCKLHGSGHVFFSLADEMSRIDCFLPGAVFRSLSFAPADGMEIVAEGFVSVYEKGGRYSLSIRRLTAAGRGDLAQSFEKLKQKLAAKGYFDEARKKALPVFPLSVAVVTSDTGAAIEDMLKIIRTRNSVCDVLVFPTLVQGHGAAAMIAARIRQVNAGFADTGVIIVGRGGGSSEDLSAFNAETVADAIYASKIPVISAVGHETDFTIADFVADRRAETPTAAAALAVPDTAELRGDLEALLGVLESRTRGIVSRLVLRMRANNMGALILRLKSGLAERGAHTGSLRLRLDHGARRAVGRGARAALLRVNLQNAAERKMERFAARSEACMEKLDALSPLRVLSRGYAIIEDADGRAVTCAGALKAGQAVNAHFADGSAEMGVRTVTVYGRNGG
jgi:exodeoxyribonuclease VII large subunit